MSVFNLSFEIALSLCSPWSFSGQHFIKDDSDGPDVALEAVHVLIKGFKRHVNWRANIVATLLFDVLLFYGESKICNLGFAIDKEDICRFEITMNNAEFVDSSIAVDDLFQDGEGLCLRNNFFLF